jgi:DNA-binding transcriptional ArsR family regulator
MTNNKKDQFSESQQNLALMGKILSHPARVAIIQLLAKEKEIKTGDISQFLPISRTTTSQHLKFLKDNGIIRGSIDGLKIHYCLDMEILVQMKVEINTFFDQAISTYMCNCE